MWVRRAAIRPIPPHARLTREVLERAEVDLVGDDDSIDALAAAFERFERAQPTLAGRVEGLLESKLGETAVALGYFLSLAMWWSFDAMHGSRLGMVDEQALEATRQSLELDEKIRRDAPDEVIETDDIVAMEQPFAVAFLREHIEVAIEDETDVDIGEIDRLYRLLLVELVALSHAVRAPEHLTASSPEWTA